MASSVVEGGGDMAEEEEEEGESDEDSEDTKDNFSFKVLMNTITRYEGDKKYIYFRSRIPSPGPLSRSRSPRSSRGTLAGRRARAR